MQKRKIINLSDAINDDNAVNYKQLQATNTNVTTNTKVGLLNSKNIRTNKAEITSLEQRTTTSFFSQVSGSKVYQIKDVNADSQSGLEFIYQPNNFTLFLRKQIVPTETIDLFSKNTTGFYNNELNSKLNLTLKSYKFI